MENKGNLKKRLVDDLELIVKEEQYDVLTLCHVFKAMNDYVFVKESFKHEVNVLFGKEVGWQHFTANYFEYEGLLFKGRYNRVQEAHSNSGLWNVLVTKVPSDHFVVEDEKEFKYDRNELVRFVDMMSVFVLDGGFDYDSVSTTFHTFYGLEVLFTLTDEKFRVKFMFEYKIPEYRVDCTSYSKEELGNLFKKAK
jgi:hypothetical protein